MALLIASALLSAALQPTASELTRAIYELSHPPQVVAFVTGGGAQLFPLLLATPGASSSVLELASPYSRRSLVELIGYAPWQYCGPEVARDLADAAFSRACALCEAEVAEEGTERAEATDACMGLGCTAALRSEPMKRGEHRCFVAVRTAAGVHELSLTLAKGMRSREREDAVVGRVALLALAHACGVESASDVGGSDVWRLDPDCDTDATAGGGADAETLLHSFVPYAATGP